jgi:LuxR family maltose regulon positive regulatory protein
MAGGVESAGESAGVAALGAGAGARGVVSRPRLFERLEASARVSVVCAPPGSGKTVLVRSWLAQAGLEERAAWVSVGRGERDPQWFWLSVLGALRRTVPGSDLVRPVTAAPDLDGWALVERVLKDLAPLAEPVWLVVDDLHESGGDAVLRQLELLLMRATPQLRFVLATRHDVGLGLHRLRLEGELTEIREAQLRFTVDEAEQLFQAAGVELPAVGPLLERTEGWAAGLRLAALSLAGHPDPARLAAEFSGSERTVAEYLLAEVLERQSEPVRRLLLRTSVLERVNGDLAELLTGDAGAERVLQDLQAANAFVVAVDARRSWFRYHQLFADLLRLELRRTAPGEVAGLHRAAAGWFAGHGWPVEAIRHAQAAGDWARAAQLLADHWPGLYLDGRNVTTHDLLAAFPAEVRADDAGLAALTAADELTHGSLEAAQRYLELARQASASVPEARGGQLRLLLGIVQLLLARQRGSLQAVAEQAQRLQAMAEAPDVVHPGLGDDLRALALISLGIVELWASRFDQADRHLEQGVALARHIERPFLECSGLSYQAAIDIFRSFPLAVDHGTQAVELARRHGWTDEPAAGTAYVILAGMRTCEMRLEEADSWMQRAERVLNAHTEPAAMLGMHYTRGLLDLAHGRDADALAAFGAADQLGGRLAVPHILVRPARALLLHTLIRLGRTQRAEQAVADLSEEDRHCGELLVATAALRLAQNDPGAAVTGLVPVLAGSAPLTSQPWLAQPFLLEAIARDALGEQDAAHQALERALDIAEPDGALLLFALHPVPGLLERHARSRTTHAALIADIQSLLAGRIPASPSAGPRPLLEAISDSELRVLRHLPTNLTAPQISQQLSVSLNTVKTHMRNLYTKLDSHSRAEAVERARALGLLAPSPTLRASK